MTLVYAPWTPEQVAALNAWQADDRKHPFTCTSGRRMDPEHSAYQSRHPDQDYGQLVAEPDGWRCPVCNYRQTWAHHFMMATP